MRGYQELRWGDGQARALLEAAGHGEDLPGALFRPVKNNTGGTLEGAVTADGIYKMEVKYSPLSRQKIG
jgi:integrase/recombinase XerD